MVIISITRDGYGLIYFLINEDLVTQQCDSRSHTPQMWHEVPACAVKPLRGCRTSMEPCCPSSLQPRSSCIRLCMYMHMCRLWVVALSLSGTRFRAELFVLFGSRAHSPPARSAAGARRGPVPFRSTRSCSNMATTLTTNCGSGTAIDEGDESIVFYGTPETRL